MSNLSGIQNDEMHWVVAEFFHSTFGYQLIDTEKEKWLSKSDLLVFHIERPILDDNPKPHKFTYSGRQPSSVTEA